MKILFVFFFVNIFFSCEPKKIDYEVTTQQIYNEFQENEVAALSKYKGKKVRVTGEIISFNNLSNKNYCFIGSHGDFIGEVKCLMSDEFYKNAGNYRVGQIITLEGFVVGKSFTGVVEIE
jgi:uncharacterized membrane protein YcgQ (UPF0703/DUF1980 family)